VRGLMCPPFHGWLRRKVAPLPDLSPLRLLVVNLMYTGRGPTGHRSLCHICEAVAPWKSAE